MTSPAGERSVGKALPAPGRRRPGTSSPATPQRLTRASSDRARTGTGSASTPSSCATPARRSSRCSASRPASSRGTPRPSRRRSASTRTPSIAADVLHSMATAKGAGTVAFTLGLLHSRQTEAAAAAQAEFDAGLGGRLATQAPEMVGSGGPRSAQARPDAWTRPDGTDKLIEAAGGVLVAGVHRRVRHRGRPGPPAEVRRLVDPQGQARARRAPGDRCDPRGVEETGYVGVPGRPLGEIRYFKDGTPKRVRYWAMQVASGEFARQRRGRPDDVAAAARGAAAPAPRPRPGHPRRHRPSRRS